MFELGEGAVAAHTGVGTYAAESGVDVLVTVGSAAGATARGFEAVGGRGKAVTTVGRDEAADWLRHNVSAADVVLVKASRGAALELLADDLIEQGSSTA
jgi:UDP-N-acetylmuramoyl-tripeptide--D-alanyl-D-alanine ligase